jgi:hypothetical protein
MRRGLTTVIGVALAALLLMPSAGACRIVGTDPDDRRPLGSDPDIRSSILEVGPRENGRFLVLVVRAFEEFGDYWTIRAYLDAQGPRRRTDRADHTMVLWNADTGGAGCTVRERGQGNPEERGVFRQNGRAARCRVPIRFIQPDRPIRWRLVSTSGYVKGNVERAPDHGMYG